jgi:anti-sigma-K factor RskA
MNVETRPGEHADPELEQLVAYLDGELDAEAAREVEQRLAADAAYRQRLNRLQQSWELLEHLPKATIEPTFTQSTVAMVVVKAADDVEQWVSARTRLQRFAWAGGLALATLAFVVGYGGWARVGDRENRRLLRDLPVIEKIGEYRYVDTVDFLRTLDREGLFAEEEVGDEL